MERKSLAKNSLYNVTYKGMNVIFPLLTTMYVSRILLASGVGKIASAQNLATYFTLIAALGLPTYGTRKIAENALNQDKLSKVFSELYLINCLSTIICVISYYSIIFFEFRNFSELKLYMVVGIQIVLNLFNIDWFYQGIEQYKYIMKRSIFVKLLSFACIILFVKEKNDYLIYALISTLAIAFNYVFNMFHLKGKVKFKIKNIELTRHIKPVLVLLASSIAIEIYSLADVTMLTAMTDSKIVGYYSTAIKGIKIIKNFITSICAVFLPRLSYFYSTNDSEKFLNLVKSGLQVILCFSMPAAFATFLLSKQAILGLFGSDFYPAILTTRILAPSILTIAISNFIGYQVLVSTGHEKNMMNITIFGAILNIILNFILIPKYLHNGASIASVITEAIVAFSQYFVMYKIFKISVGNSFLKSIFVSTLCMSICIIFIIKYVKNYFLCCCLSAMIGIFIYFSILIMQKNEIAIKVLKKIKLD